MNLSDLDGSPFDRFVDVVKCSPNDVLKKFEVVDCNDKIGYKMLDNFKKQKDNVDDETKQQMIAAQISLTEEN